MRQLRKIALLILLLSLLTPRSVFAQQHKIRFGHLFHEGERWQSGQVYEILQDNQGFMWFGTRDGLYKYDGYSLIAYRNDPDDYESLGDNRVRAVHQDRSGAFWIGTMGGGLNRFVPETEQFIRYQHDENDPYSLGGNDVRVVFEDRDGNLWIGTKGGGLNRFVPETDDGQPARFIRYESDEGDPHSLSSNNVTVIFEGRSGELWIGTLDGGLNRLDRATNEDQPARFVRHQHDESDAHSLGDNEVLDIFEDRFGTLWVGTRKGGLSRLDRETGQFTNYRHNPDDPHSLGSPGNGVWIVYEDRAGALWIGTLTGGINRFDRETEQFTRYEVSAGESIYTILEDQTGELWMGGLQRGVYRYDRAGDRFLNYQHDDSDPYSLSHNLVWTMYEDRAGGLWFGTWGGIDIHQRVTAQFTSYTPDPNDPQSLSHASVQAVYQDRAGEVWIGTREGLNRWDRATDQFTQYFHDDDDPQSLSESHVIALHEDQLGTFWVGTLQSGLSSFDRETGQSIHYRYDKDDPHSLSHDYVKVIYEDQEGTLWIGTYNGLNRFDRTTQQFTCYRNDPNDPNSLSHDNVLALYQDRHGAFWVGTYRGLNRFDRETEQFTRYQVEPGNPQGLTNDAILVIYEDRAGRFWIGTDGGGIHRFDRESETFANYRMKHGLPSDVVYGILEDDASPDSEGGNLWLSTNKGLSRFDPQTETFKNYGVHDGLAGNRFEERASHRLQSGELLFGGSDGFTVFDPENITDNPYLPPVVLTDLLLFNEPVRPSSEEGALLQKAIPYVDTLTLSHKDYVISFEFAALNYALPEKNRYAYKLEGFEDDWNYTSAERRFATYTSLPAGEYTFRVKAANNDGVWNEEGTSLSITVLPPWWETGWAYTLYVLIVVSGVAGFVRWRLRKSEAQRRQLETQVAERTYDLDERVKELNCLYGIPNLVETPGISLDEILQGTAELIPPAWQYPEVTCARIILGDQEFRTENFREMTWKQTSDIIAYGERTGAVEVYYLEERPESDDGPFLKRERNLINAIAERLGRIAEQKQAEEALRKAQDELEKRVRERTAELVQANAALRAEIGQRKQAQEAELLMTQFISNVSHELRTPLSVISLISGNLDTLYERLDDPKRRQMIQDIREYTRVLNDLIGSVLELSRIDSERVSTERQRLDLAQLARQEADKQQPLAQKKSQSLRVTGSEHLAVWGNADQLQRVVRNLLNNAIKYTPDGGQITCECLAWADGATVDTTWPGSDGLPVGRWAALRVVDNGPGISQEHLSNVFERFFRVESQGSILGTGLGLAIAQELVNLHEGHIAVYSVPGEGSTFAVYLPLLEE